MNTVNTTETPPPRKSLLKHFINKFEAISEDKWCDYKLSDGNGRHCALGHTMSPPGTFVDWSNTTEETNQLKLLTNFTIAQVNNGHHNNYRQPTIKGRVLAYLHDLLAKEIRP